MSGYIDPGRARLGKLTRTYERKPFRTERRTVRYFVAAWVPILIHSNGNPGWEYAREDCCHGRGPVTVDPGDEKITTYRVAVSVTLLPTLWRS
jgi:hypothetical protein